MIYDCRKFTSRRWGRMTTLGRAWWRGLELAENHASKMDKHEWLMKVGIEMDEHMINIDKPCHLLLFWVMPILQTNLRNRRARDLCWQTVLCKFYHMCSHSFEGQGLFQSWATSGRYPALNKGNAHLCDVPEVAAEVIEVIVPVSDSCPPTLRKKTPVTRRVVQNLVLLEMDENNNCFRCWMNVCLKSEVQRLAILTCFYRVWQPEAPTTEQLLI